MLRVFVITCDKYSWALKGFIHQFQKYWSTLQPVVVGGYSLPDSIELPDNFTFHSIADREYGKNEWSTGLIQFLRAMPDDHFVLLLEDYWLCRGVNHQAVGTLHELCMNHPDVLRMDLTDDRQYNGEVRDWEVLPYYGYNDIIFTPPKSPYQMSLQAGIWNRKLLLEVLKPDKSAWQVELETGEKQLSKYVVLGTRQRPVRYANVFRGGDASPEALNLTYLLPGDVDELRVVGALEK
jgi:hypothetical protein